MGREVVTKLSYKNTVFLAPGKGYHQTEDKPKKHMYNVLRYEEKGGYLSQMQKYFDNLHFLY